MYRSMQVFLLIEMHLEIHLFNRNKSISYVYMCIHAASLDLHFNRIVAEGVRLQNLSIRLVLLSLKFPLQRTSIISNHSFPCACFRAAVLHSVSFLSCSVFQDCIYLALNYRCHIETCKSRTDRLLMKFRLHGMMLNTASRLALSDECHTSACKH